MKVLWAPWRLAYVENPEPAAGCIFCDKPRLEGPAERREALVLRATEQVSVIMNRFPYANGNLMVAPRCHTSEFAAMGPENSASLADELRRTVGILERVYAPQGFNIGMNLGRVAGAGVADHLHWHVVPRWEGDTNFMPLIAETRVIPQHLEDAYDRMVPLFEAEAVEP